MIPSAALFLIAICLPNIYSVPMVAVKLLCDGFLLRLYYASFFNQAQGYGGRSGRGLSCNAFAGQTTSRPLPVA